MFCVYELSLSSCGFHCRVSRGLVDEIGLPQYLQFFSLVRIFQGEESVFLLGVLGLGESGDRK